MASWRGGWLSVEIGYNPRPITPRLKKAETYLPYRAKKDWERGMKGRYSGSVYYHWWIKGGRGLIAKAHGLLFNIFVPISYVLYSRYEIFQPQFITLKGIEYCFWKVVMAITINTVLKKNYAWAFLSLSDIITYILYLLRRGCPQGIFNFCRKTAENETLCQVGIYVRRFFQRSAERSRGFQQIKLFPRLTSADRCRGGGSSLI